jgi:hypothetical protein
LFSALNEAPIRFMEDWEEFFAEKSRRRALTVRRRGSFRLIRNVTFGILFFAACVLLVMFLTS